jgi:hypothetical protein
MRIVGSKTDIAAQFLPLQFDCKPKRPSKTLVNIALKIGYASRQKISRIDKSIFDLGVQQVGWKRCL